MAFLGWFKNKKEKEVLVSKRNQDILEDTAVATTFAEAGEHETARSIMSNENKKGHNTILVIGREDSFSDWWIFSSISLILTRCRFSMR